MVYITGKILIFLKSHIYASYIPNLILMLQPYIYFWREISNTVYGPLTRNAGKMLIFCPISKEMIQ